MYDNFKALLGVWDKFDDTTENIFLYLEKNFASRQI